jgi:hypothetical protein
MESSVIIARDQLVIMAGGGPNGNLVVARATPTSYQEVLRANGIISGNTWTAPTLANGRLYLRSQNGALICFDVNGDVDNDGIADAWETQYFPAAGTNTSPSADFDGDGWDNLSEYIAGTNPTNDDGRLEVRIAFSNGQVVVSYPTIRTNGPGYNNLNRYYNLEDSTNLQVGPWVPVPGATNVVGDNTVRTFTNVVPSDAEFYRVKVRLQ